MILYYSGTGNSRYAASVLSSQSGDALVSMNDIMRQRITDPYAARYSFVQTVPLFLSALPTAGAFPGSWSSLSGTAALKAAGTLFLFDLRPRNGAAAKYAED